MLKKLTTIVLLGFVAAAVIALAMRAGGTGGAVPPPPVAAPVTIAVSRLVAFYFHGDKRCQSCNAIERMTREALKTETAGGVLEIRSLNVDQAENAHYVQDFQLAMRTVVLAEELGGKIVRWKRLDECWDRFGEPEDFASYIQRSFKAFQTVPPAAP